MNIISLKALAILFPIQTNNILNFIINSKFSLFLRANYFEKFIKELNKWQK